MQKRFARDLQTLPSVIEAVTAYCREHGASGDSLYAMSFAVEEIFTNMVKYNPDGPKDVALSFATADKALVVRLEDEQEHSFDPTASPDPDLELKLAERKPGGLGLYLVRKMIRNVLYERSDKRSVVTLTHPLE